MGWRSSKEKAEGVRGLWAPMSCPGDSRKDRGKQVWGVEKEMGLL